MDCLKIIYFKSPASWEQIPRMGFVWFFYQKILFTDDEKELKYQLDFIEKHL